MTDAWRKGRQRASRGDYAAQEEVEEEPSFWACFCGTRTQWHDEDADKPPPPRMPAPRMSSRRRKQEKLSREGVVPVRRRTPSPAELESHRMLVRELQRNSFSSVNMTSGEETQPVHPVVKEPPSRSGSKAAGSRKQKRLPLDSSASEFDDVSAHDRGTPSKVSTREPTMLSGRSCLSSSSSFTAGEGHYGMFPPPRTVRRSKRPSAAYIPSESDRTSGRDRRAESAAPAALEPILSARTGHQAASTARSSGSRARGSGSSRGRPKSAREAGGAPASNAPSSREGAITAELRKLREEAAQLRLCIREEGEGHDLISCGDSVPEKSPQLRLVQLKGEACKLRDHLRATRKDGGDSVESSDVDDLLGTNRADGGVPMSLSRDRLEDPHAHQLFGEEECRAASEVPLRLLYRSLKVHFRGARCNSRQRIVDPSAVNE
eukprot:TRINITY_DN19811_c0_g1_i1.p1 TRINITY_DN19811_c0_g1~~TRINITY_DN19811_c0_g1_i1.p1  ORF type:complete len:434 (-),score=68.61 TRINITY_DN19811_c0_g1_i1:56-1357(-)